MSIDRRKMIALGAGVAAFAATAGSAAAGELSAGRGPSDAALARSLPGDFQSRYAKVNGTRLHYVTGGRGEPLVLLPGWPQTWWEYRKVLPALAARYRVIAVDLRGMGGSDKPQSGYDKKTAAKDVYELVRQLGYQKAYIAGHDIGSMVAYSYAANHPEATAKLVMMDVGHPNAGLFHLPMLPEPGAKVHLWWFAFNQVRGLPEQLLTGRFRYLVDWLFDNLLTNPAAISDRDREIFARAYNTPDAIRAGNAWYQTFHQDIDDGNAYQRLTAPLLGLTTADSEPFNRPTWMSQGPEGQTTVTVVPNAGHYFVEEQPEFVTRALTAFLG